MTFGALQFPSILLSNTILTYKHGQTTKSHPQTPNRPTCLQSRSSTTFKLRLRESRQHQQVFSERRIEQRPFEPNLRGGKSSKIRLTPIQPLFSVRMQTRISSMSGQCLFNAYLNSSPTFSPKGSNNFITFVLAVNVPITGSSMEVIEFCFCSAHTVTQTMTFSQWTQPITMLEQIPF